MNDCLLIIFVKNPVLGKVKTRLAATLGPHRALLIYLKLLEYTKEITAKLPMDKVVYYSDSIDENDLWDNAIYQKKLQDQHNLGIRIKSAFEWGFQQGYRKICIIGSDCFELTSKIISNGFQALETYDAVLGPSRDGGYYLLGLKEVKTEIFEKKDWGTDSVASATIADFNKLALSYSLLPPLNDIDVEADLGGIEF
ncbi:MAG: hypothetical protein DHS20C17_31220 [Cyclobacteriaceae bacterium]|nr:MAG: hypothetical protein DHS20C17_31220 [Cyclobacteriaceae bacterium]